MTTSREIITLQVGHYANFVGTHWWNLQESTFSYDQNVPSSNVINHDILFREGRTLQNEVTFTPRLIAIDLKDSLKSLKPEGILYDIPTTNNDILWNDKLIVHKMESYQKNEFLQDLVKEEEQYLLENMGPPDSKIEFEKPTNHLSSEPTFGKKKYNLDYSVEVWTDFLRLHFHPKSILMIPEYYHESENESFNIFGYGVQAFNNNQSTKEAFEDKLHFFSEECDLLQGFQLIISPSDGFGGFSTCLAEMLAEEFPSKGVITWSVEPLLKRCTSQDIHYSSINTLLSFEKMCSYSSLFSPLCLAQGLGIRQNEPINFPYLNYKECLKYHTGAILGTYLDTVTLPYRLERYQTDIKDMAHSLTVMNKNVALSSICLPFPLAEDSFLYNAFAELSDRIPWQSITPYCDATSPCHFQSIVLRGISINRINSMTPSLDKSKPVPSLSKLYQSCSSGEEMLKYFTSQACPSALSMCSFINYGCKITSPYPDIFSPFINKNGLISNLKRPESQEVEQTSVAAGLHASDEIYKFVEQLCLEAKQCDIRKCHKFLEAGLELDDYEEILNNMETLAKNSVSQR